MFEHDFPEFGQVLDSVFLLNPRWPRLEAGAKALFFKALEPYSLQAVRQAFTAHIRDPKRGSFQPMPADIVAHIEAANGGDGRPGVEEAWALSFPAVSELETVVWTEEMRDAFAICRPLLEAFDNVGARMAFKDAYARLVHEAKRAARPARWELSAGHDQAKRQIAVQHAAKLGRIAAPQASLFLPMQVSAQERCPEGLARLKEMMKTLVPPSVKAAQRREEELRQEAAAIVARKQELARQEHDGQHV
jgi:hypothetical protein